MESVFFKDFPHYSWKISKSRREDSFIIHCDEEGGGDTGEIKETLERLKKLGLECTFSISKSKNKTSYHPSSFHQNPLFQCRKTLFDSYIRYILRTYSWLSNKCMNNLQTMEISLDIVNRIKSDWSRDQWSTKIFSWLWDFSVSDIKWVTVQYSSWLQQEIALCLGRDCS